VVIGLESTRKFAGRRRAEPARARGVRGCAPSSPPPGWILCEQDSRSGPVVNSTKVECALTAWWCRPGRPWSLRPPCV